jgi:hypothetical protein
MRFERGFGSLAATAGITAIPLGNDVRKPALDLSDIVCRTLSREVGHDCPCVGMHRPLEQRREHDQRANGKTYLVLR